MVFMTNSCLQGVLVTEWGESLAVAGTAGIAVLDPDAAPAGIGAGRVGGGRRNLHVQAE